MILTVPHSGSRFVQQALKDAGLPHEWGTAIRHLYTVPDLKPGDIVVMRDPERTFLANWRDVEDAPEFWGRKKRMLNRCLDRLRGDYRRFRIDLDDWSVLCDYVGHELRQPDNIWSTGRGGNPPDGWEWVERYEIFYS